MRVMQYRTTVLIYTRFRPYDIHKSRLQGINELKVKRILIKSLNALVLLLNQLLVELLFFALNVLISI